MNLINRQQISEMLGYTSVHIRNLDFLPAKVKKENRIDYFDKSEVLKRYHEKRAKKTDLTMSHYVKQDAKKNLFVAFMAGTYDRQDQKNSYQLKKLASKHTQPKTTKIQLFGDFNKTKNDRSREWMKLTEPRITTPSS